MSGIPSIRAASAQPAFTNGLRPSASSVQSGRLIRTGMRDRLCSGHCLWTEGRIQRVNGSYSGNWIAGDSGRQQTPKCCHNRNQGLCASISSCLRFAAEMSLALSGLMSGASNISCSCSMSSMMRSTSMRPNHLVRDGNGSNGTAGLRLYEPTLT